MRKLLDWFRREPVPEPEPEPELEPLQRPLIELVDEYIAFMGPYDRNAHEVWKLRHRLGKLMHKHGIRYIARKDCLLKLGVSLRRGLPCAEIRPLPARLDGHVSLDGVPAAHLIPLVDRLLEADAGYRRDEDCRMAIGKELAKAMQVKGYDFILHRGYQFKRIGTAFVNVDPVADFDG